MSSALPTISNWSGLYLSRNVIGTPIIAVVVAGNRVDERHLDRVVSCRIAGSRRPRTSLCLLNLMLSAMVISCKRLVTSTVVDVGEPARVPEPRVVTFVVWRIAEPLGLEPIGVGHRRALRDAEHHVGAVGRGALPQFGSP